MSSDPTPPRAPLSYLWSKYRLTQERYDEMLAAQDGKCAICDQTPRTRLVVDHDHRCCPTGRTCGHCIRALLCNACNTALGFVERAGIPSLHDYLVRHPGTANTRSAP